MKDPMYEITMAAANLKIVAPEQYDALLKAFQMLDDKTGSDLRASPPEMIMSQQGRAALAFQLRQRFEQCMERRKEYEKRA